MHPTPVLDRRPDGVLPLEEIRRPSQHRRVDGTRTHGIDPYVLFGVIYGHRPRQGVDAAFARRVGRHSCLRGNGLHARHVDDRPSPTLSHLGNGMPGRQIYPLEVDAEDFVPNLLLGLRNRPVALNPGAIDEHVYPSVGLNGEVDEGFHVRRGSHVPPHPSDFQVLFAQSAGRLCGLILAVAADHDGGSLPGQLPRGCEPDAGPATGYYGHLTAHLVRHTLPPSSTSARSENPKVSDGPIESAVTPPGASHTKSVSVGLWLNSMISVPLSTSTPTLSFSFSRKTTRIPLYSYSRIRAPQFLCSRYLSSLMRPSYLPGSRSTTRETRLPAGTANRTFSPSILASSRCFSRCDPTQARATRSSPNETRTSSLSEDRDGSIPAGSCPRLEGARAMTSTRVCSMEQKLPRSGKSFPAEGAERIPSRGVVSAAAVLIPNSGVSTSSPEATA